MDEAQIPNYIRLLIDGIETTTAAPGVAHLTVQHDDWCPQLNGGACRCNPNMLMGRLGEEG